jgi:hypothetical protein
MGVFPEFFDLGSDFRGGDFCGLGMGRSARTGRMRGGPRLNFPAQGLRAKDPLRGGPRNLNRANSVNRSINGVAKMIYMPVDRAEHNKNSVHA